MIGVFDSGYGGLTILRALVDRLPQYSYCYLGDNRRAPYGNRPPEEIYEFTRQGVEHLFERDCQLVILGCNTASAVALRRLQQEWLPEFERTRPPKLQRRRVLGILVPTVEQITGVPWKHEAGAITRVGTVTVGVLATEQTVRSRAYEYEIHKRNPSIEVIQQACPGLVEAIEQDEHDEVNTLTTQYVRELMAAAPNLQAVLLGCTHYELVAQRIASLLLKETRLYHQPTIVAKSLAGYLARHPEMAAHLAATGKKEFFTSGDPATISLPSQRYFGELIHFEALVLGR